MKKIVLKLYYADEKMKQKAMQKVSGLSGLVSISLDSKEKILTITGDIDPVTAASKLRKLCHTEIVSVGSEKEPEKKKEEPKKEEPKKEWPKKEEPKKGDTKKDEKKESPKVEIAPWIKAYQAYSNYPNYYQQQPYQQSLVASAAVAPPQYYSRAVEEYPNGCVIC